MNDDPRVDLPEIRIGIRAWALSRGAALRICLRDACYAEYAEAHREESSAPEEAPSIG
jgi:hypothetical protein